jgi:hypothetical protein
MILKKVLWLWVHDLYYSSFHPSCDLLSSFACSMILRAFLDGGSAQIDILYFDDAVQFSHLSSLVSLPMKDQTVLWCQKSTNYGVPGWTISIIVLYGHHVFVREAYNSLQNKYMYYSLSDRIGLRIHNQIVGKIDYA